MAVRKMTPKIFVVFLLSFCFYSSPFLSSLSFSAETRADAPKKICLKEQCLNIEVARTDIERARGLQDRESLGDDYGMLFVFESQGMYNFWMKDTLVPLDMIWIDKDHKIVDIKSDVPPCKSDPCEIFVPAAEAQYVLETKAGLSKVVGFNVGDELKFQ